MSGDHWRENLEAAERWLRGLFHRRAGLWVRIGAVALLVIFVPLTLLDMSPEILGLFAPPIDLSKDLYSINRPVAFTFLDAEGHDAGHRGAVVGDRLSIAQMPPYLPAAFIAMEDRSFYTNAGIDPKGLLRAALANWHAGHVVAGGSTITQQTAKIIFTSQERTYARKVQELVEAAELQKSLSKTQILELYLNRIYLGSGAYGVDGAAHTYFGISAQNVSLAQAAMLATLTRAPSVFSPRRDLAAAQARASLVLDAMVETGAITPQQAADAKAHPAVVVDHTQADARNFFLDTAADEALKMVSRNGVAPTSDLVVHTTLEPALQEAARHAVAHVLGTKGRKAHAHEAAVVLMKVDGAVPALIGGRDYDASTFNRATQAHRQPGSAFKPFVYLAAMENGISPWDVRTDGPVDINGWQPTNYGGRHYGTLTLAQALAHSVNTITAGLGQEVGISTVVEAAHRCGIVSELGDNPSLVLGTSEVTPMELTTAYGTFASGGLRVYPYLVTEVDDSAGHVLYRRKAPEDNRVVASHVDRDVVRMMYGVMTQGTGRGAAIAGHEAAGKTGTTQDYRDAWFVGYTTDYVAGVWVGNDDSSPMHNVTGGTLPAEIWKSVMTVAEKGLPATPLDMSPEEPPNAQTDTTELGTADEESQDGGVNSVSGPITDEDQQQEQEQQAQQQPGSDDNDGQRRGFFDWLFGRGQPRQEQEPQQPRSAPQSQYPSDAPPQAMPPQPYPQQYAPQDQRQYAPPDQRQYPPPDQRQYPPPDQRQYSSPYPRQYAPQYQRQYQQYPPPDSGYGPPPPPPNYRPNPNVNAPQGDDESGDGDDN
ncbi:MAG: PBP1A family penicillin-binding protein [Rhizomicrobium sp.]